CRHLFGPGRRTRFRPSYFQFTEPSAEVDVSCGLCDGAGCRTCGGSGWLEMGGSGMVHPKVLREAGYDPENLSGWAWGLGIERMAMLRHGIDDIRVFSENEPAALDQIA
ncbi:MAG: phenylalanine--tRNA ligase subunit alpha, partial [Candidatus Eremiobacteraeota bacterium]|nr:phenylalanine--tRNA ligase subunit alpha [Candidatus Eremiobacteraeota bacterium]